MPRWFLYPLTEHANEAFRLQLPEESFHEQFPCKEKSQPLPLWECNSYEDVQRFIRNEAQLRISFEVYKLEDGEKEATFWERIVQRNKKKRLPPPGPPKQTFVQPDPKDEKGPFD